MIGLMLHDQDRNHLVSIQPPPKLDPGYYVVLHTKAKLPKEMSFHIDNDRTYIGPLPHIKACHENRVKIRPTYPGVETELVKINSQSV